MVLMAGRDARPEFPVGPFYVKECSLHGFVMFKATAVEMRSAAEEISHWMAGGKLEAIDIHLLEARVTLSGLRINPPPGFEPHPLLDLQMVEVDIAPWALLKGRIVVDDLSRRQRAE